MSKKPFKTIISANLHTSAACARGKTPGLFYVYVYYEVTLDVGSNVQIGF